MFLKNTLKSFLIASLLASSIAITPKAEARGSQWSTGATVFTTAAVIFAGITVVLSWVGTKCYFANQNGKRQLKLLKEYNDSQVNIYPTVPTETGSNPEINKLPGTNPEVKTPMTYEELSNKAKANHVKQLCSTSSSLKYKYPVAYMCKNIDENKKFRKINRVFGDKFKTLDKELSKERIKLVGKPELEKENNEYITEYHNTKSLFHTSWDKIISAFGNLLTGVAHMKQAETNRELAKKQQERDKQTVKN